MLKRLSIRNFAIIENIDLELKEGFSVLTGGTGAGKSLIIDSLSLLLGSRASSELIRTGEEKAIIVGEFEAHVSRLDALLSRLEIPVLDGNIKIERTISKTKNVIKVNGVPVSLSELNQISSFLADIHNQFDFQKILNADNYLGIVDGFAYEMVAPFKLEYQDAYHRYLQSVKELENLKKKKQEFDENQDFYAFQLNELEAMDLKQGEEEELKDSISLMRNYDKVYALTQEADKVFHSDALDQLYELKLILSKLSSYQNQYQTLAEQIDDRYYELEDLFKTLKKNFASIDYDPSALETMLQRQSDIASLKRKYRKNVAELIAFKEELKTMFEDSSSMDEEIKSKEIEMEQCHKDVLSKAEELTNIRKRIASSIEKELSSSLADLLLKTRFSIAFLPHEQELLGEDGSDEIDFLIETNVGEGLKPLAKIVSGGEASRIMLAFKSIFVKSNNVATVIFDEIDTGISGEAAEAVAKKIKEMSYARQVIAITHLPQVASMSDHHILIEKEVKSGRTFVIIKELNLNEKIEEIAHLISGGKVTESQRAYAKELVLGRSL